MGRKRTKQKIVRLSEEINTRIDQEAERRDLSQNELMVRLMEYGLDRFEMMDVPPKW